MKKRNIGITVLTVTIVLVSLVFGIKTFINTEDNKTADKEQTSTISQNEKVEVLVSKEDAGFTAADKINKIEKKEDYEKSLRSYLEEQYSKEDFKDIEEFNDAIDDRGDIIKSNYKAAYTERNKKGLNYKTGEVIIVATDISKKEATDIVEDEGGQVKSINTSTDGNTMVLAKISNEDTVAKASDKIDKASNSIKCQPNFIYKIKDTEVKKPSYSNENWHLDKIQKNEAWKELGAPKNPVRVAIIDTGADINHSALKGSINIGKSIKISDGKVSPLKRDSDNHGTHITGILAGQPNSNNGWSGVATGYVDLLVVDSSVRDSGESIFNSYDLAASIDYVMNNGAKVINMSLGGFGKDEIVEKYIDKCADKNILVVCAGGNENSNKYTSPGDDPSAVSVINTTKSDERNSHRIIGSNYGYNKDISAPGTAIYSTVPKNKFEAYTGTSMASPVVSGVAALMLYANPNLTYQQMKTILYSSSDDIGSVGFDQQTGFGRVNAYNAVTMAKKANSDIEPKGIIINRSSIDTYRNLVSNVEYSFLNDINAPSIKGASFKSLDESIAKINSKGKIVGLKAGSTSVQINVGSLSKVIKVNVKDPYNTSISKIPYEKSAALSNKSAPSYSYYGLSNGFYYNGKKGEIIDFCMYTKNFDPGLMIFDTKGNIIAENDNVKFNDDFDYNTDARIRIVLPKTERYYIQGQSLGDPSGSMTYKFRMLSSKVHTKLTGSREKKTSVKLKWNKLKGIDGYKIFRSNSKYGAYKSIKTIKSKDQSNITLTKVSKKYYYKITPYRNFSDGEYIYGGHSNIINK